MKLYIGFFLSMVMVFLFRPSAQAQRVFSMEVDSVNRMFLLETSDNFRSKELPLVIILHENEVSPAILIQNDRQNLQQKALIAFPIAFGLTWKCEPADEANDVRFLHKMIDKLYKDFQIDLSKVFVVSRNETSCKSATLDQISSGKIRANLQWNASQENGQPTITDGQLKELDSLIGQYPSKSLPTIPGKWELDLHQKNLKDREERDSLAIQSGNYVPGFTLNLKSQFPIQQALGIEVMTPFFLSFYAGYGQFSRFYTVIALDVLPETDPSQSSRKQLIKDKLNNGSVFELGTYFHFVNRSGLYGGINIQFQKFDMTTTAQEMVEKYDFGNSSDFADEIQDIIENNNLVKDFYENTEISPTIKPIQLGLLVGKRFRFKKAPQLGLHLELAYHFNINTKTTLTSPSFIGQIIVDSFVNPILESNSDISFDAFNLPSLTARLSYNLGKILYKL